MPQVDFYVLPSAAPSDRLDYACKLSALAWQQGLSVYVRGIDEAQCEAIDERLWRFRGDSFVPHDLLGDGPAPVLIGCDEPPAEHHGLLINLGEDVPGYHGRFARIAELVIEQPEILQRSRQHFVHYREQGYPLRNHRLNRC